MPTGAWLLSYILIWGLIAIQYIVIILLVRQVSALLNHWVKNDPDWGLPLGSLAPELPAADLFGEQIASTLRAGQKRLMFFLSTTCQWCDEAMLRVYPSSQIQGVEVILVVQATDVKTRLFLEKHRGIDLASIRVVADPRSILSSSYKVNVVPFVVVVNADDRVVAKRSAITLAEIGMLVRRADAIHNRNNSTVSS